MRKLFIAAAVALASIAVAVTAAPARPGAPGGFVFETDYGYDDASCGFTIHVEGHFVNHVIDTSFATGTGREELHQSDVAAATAKGVTLREESHYTIFVDVVDGVYTTATHVG